MNINSVATHPLQSLNWGEFRKKTGVKVVRQNGLQITIHKIPHFAWTIGYFPKGTMPTEEVIHELEKIGKNERCIFIQIEPNIAIARHSGEEERRLQNLSRMQHENVRDSGQARMTEYGLRPAAHPLFTKYTFILGLTKSEDELLKNMHPKTRYNIKVAQKHGVKVIEDNSDEAFETYLRLTRETTKRQGFYAHTENYHRLMWETLGIQNSESIIQNFDRNKLTAHLFLAKYIPPSSNSELLIINSKLQALTLAAWILFVYKDTLYYPYGASSNQYRETMASNLMMWEAIKFGKKLGLKKFDMWGALGPNPDTNDPWYGFHRFKEGYGGKLVEFVGSYDLVINPILYQLYKFADKLRWLILKLKS
ncbi:MAG: peptidoglycan bridge formation glycyltransferase FemA/FemB family protein [Patescibacteria group bacterium]